MSSQSYKIIDMEERNNQPVLASHHHPSYHGFKIRHGKELLAVTTVVSLFVASLLCLAFCMTRGGRRNKNNCCCSRKRSTNRTFATLNDWVCDMDRDDVETAGRANIATTTTTTLTDGAREEWEEITVETMFPSVVSTTGRKTRKKTTSPLNEPLLENNNRSNNNNSNNT